MNAPVTLHAVARRIALVAIERCPDFAGKKERVLIAREHGLLTEEEAQDWLSILGVQAA